jgi:DNA-binding response OmpR family regulator
MRILIVEDEAALRSFLVPVLEVEGFETSCSATGAEALAEIEDRRPDLVLLDVGLPDINGLDVCRAIRRKPGHLPVIMLTALDTPQDELAGFAAAADDYVTKPFRQESLLARIRAVLRLVAGATGAHRVRLGAVEVDLAARTARLGGKDLGLPPKEFDLLAFLVEHPGQVFGKTQLLTQVWGPEFDGDPHTVEARMSRLRAAIEPNANNPTFLRTRPGVGYYLALDQTS